jgi:hypothetical protein
MRHFPRDIEAAIKILREVCAAPKNPVPLRARCAELILAAYGISVTPPESKSRHLQLKQVKMAVEVSALDKQLAAKVRREQQEKLKQELAKL